MRTRLIAIIMILSFPALARAQSGTDVSPTILVHPGVPTILHLPDEIEGAQIRHGGEMMVKGIGSKLYVRPHPDTPAGMEALLEVKTRAAHRLFLLHVVERAEDAMREVVVPAVTTANAATEREVPHAAPAAEQPASRASTIAPAVAAPAPVPAEPERATTAIRARRFDLSVHAVVTLTGVTYMELEGFTPIEGRRPHRALGLRMAAVPRGGWWSLEVGISGERLDAPTVHVRDVEDTEEEHQVSGPWLRADVGMKAWAGTTWKPTAHVGFGLQAHLRTTERTSLMNQVRQPLHSTETMPYGAVLTAGMGLQYQANDVLLGIDLQMRQGLPAGYRSVAALLSVGFYLDTGE